MFEFLVLDPSSGYIEESWLEGVVETAAFAMMPGVPPFAG